MSSADLRRPTPRDGFAVVPRFDPPNLRGRDARTAVRSIALAVGLAAAAVLIGWLIANGETKLVFALALPIPALVIALNRRAVAPLAGILLLLILNGVPVVNLGGRLPAGIRFQDAAVMVLAVLLFAYRDRSEQAGAAPYMRAARIWSACFVAWWTLTLARSVLLEGIPIRLAIVFGRDFLYFAILLPLAVGVRLPARAFRIAGLVVLGAAVAYGIGQTVAGLTGVTLSWLVHPAIVANAVGQTTRFYSPMNYWVDTCLIFCGALLLSKHSPGDRRILGAVVFVLALSAVLGETRANYFGLIVGLLAAAVVYTRRHGSVTVLLVRVVMLILLIVCAITLFSAITGHGASITNNPIATRVSAGVSDVSQSTGTFGFRKQTDEQMLHVLGGDWPIGLGFLNSTVHYVPGLPEGSIRNSDTGVFNALMTMGLVGVLLIYAPTVYALRELLRVSRRSRASAQGLPRWILYGGTVWTAWALASSLTLDLFFSTAGVAVAAVGLAVLARINTATTAEIATTAETAITAEAAGSAAGGAGAAVAAVPGAPRRSRPGRPESARALRASRAPSSRLRSGVAPPGRSLRPGPPAGWAPAPTSAPAAARGAKPTRVEAVVPDSAAPPEVEPALMQLSAVVVTYNSAQCVSQCIKALRTALGHCEIVVVDNMSGDDTISTVWATDERVRVISKGRNAGYGSACNSGVRAATNEHVIVMNPDVLLEHADLESLQATFSETRFGVVSPCIRSDGQRVARPQTFSPGSWLSELGIMALGPFRPRAVPQRSRLVASDAAAWASGALMVVRRSEFLSLGGFDQRFFLYYEDQELSQRYRRAGLPIRGTDAVTGVHRGGGSTADRGNDRVEPMAWCLLGWLEYVAMQHGDRRAKLSWAIIRTTHYAGRRLTQLAGEVSGLARLRRKAEQLEAVHVLIMEIARQDARAEGTACPAARRIISETMQR